MKGMPSSVTAWTATLVAVLDLIALVFMAASNPKTSLLLGFSLAEACLILLAVGAWKKYFEDYVKCAIQSQDDDHFLPSSDQEIG